MVLVVLYKAETRIDYKIFATAARKIRQPQKIKAGT
jgi:hypothetical protein